MKKVIGLIVVGVASVAILSGCGLLNDIAGKANAVVFYGDEENVQEIIDSEKKEAEKYGQYDMKFLEQDEKKIMIMDQQTAQALLKDGLWRTVNEKNSTDKMKTIPDMKKDQAILFAKEANKEINIEESELEVSYGGNMIIGEGRTYVDLFLIMPDELYGAIASKEQSIGYLRYATDPSGKIQGIDVEYIQLLRMK